MTPAEELRAAATKLRETARNATDGPWASVSMQDHTFGIWSSGTGFSGEDDHLASANVAPNAAWIALMGPDKAELIAALLEGVATDVGWEGLIPSSHAALVFARSILGEAS